MIADDIKVRQAFDPTGERGGYKFETIVPLRVSLNAIIQRYPITKIRRSSPGVPQFNVTGHLTTYFIDRELYKLMEK